jgi:zinc-ribbon domain
MYCPQCGTESSEGQQYCRSCGANLKVIGKALSLSEAVARSDRGPLPKIKEMMKNLKVEQVGEEVSHALDRMNSEIVRARATHEAKQHRWPWTKTREQRSERHIVKGTCSFFSGIGLMIFLYYFCGALVLKMPPEWLAKVPFELDPVVRIFWLVGLVPTLSGLGHVLAGLFLKSTPAKAIDSGVPTEEVSTSKLAARPKPLSVTENTTALLDHK